MPPLVSVIMPSFNARKTLPRATASLVAQTYEDWECIFVDDGSTDGSCDWMREFADPRFRCFRNSANQGRGAARQLGLEQAHGEYVCMLDADDWYYPQKLRRQIDCIEADPTLVLLSADLAIVDRDNRLAGVRRTSRSHAAVVGCTRMPVCFASSIIRMEAARQVAFDPAYRIAEDRDFLLRLLPGRRSAGIPEVLYAYTEYTSTTLDKLLQANRHAQQRAHSDPTRGCIARQVVSGLYCAKSFLYQAAFALGQQERLLRARSRRPEPAEIVQFDVASKSVDAVLKRCFGFELSGVCSQYPDLGGLHAGDEPR